MSNRFGYYLLAVCIFIFAITIFVDYRSGLILPLGLFGSTTATSQASLTSNVFAQSKVYTVRQVINELSVNPAAFADQQIAIKAYRIDTSSGTGCGDFAVLIDRDFADLYQSSISSDLSSVEKEKANRELLSVPQLITGPMSNAPEPIASSQFAIYQGHFYDATATKKCQPDGWKRFYIDTKIQEFDPNNPAS